MSVSTVSATNGTATFWSSPRMTVKSEKFYALLMQVFLYGIVFLAGFIFAKIQTLVAGL